MKRSIRLAVVLCAIVLLLALIPLTWSLIHSALPVDAAAAVAADDTPTAAATITPVGTPTPLAVPTISAGSTAITAPAAPTLTGVTVATALTCVTTIIGLVIAIVTLNILLRGGYGPFLRALIFGGKRRRGKGSENGDDGADADEGLWDASHTLNYRPGPDARNDPHAAYDPFDEPVSSRRGGSSRGASRTRGGERDARRSDRYDEPARSRSGSGRRAPSRSRRNDWD
jgi:hypothetical protein